MCQKSLIYLNINYLQSGPANIIKKQNTGNKNTLKTNNLYGMKINPLKQQKHLSKTHTGRPCQKGSQITDYKTANDYEKDNKNYNVI